MKWNEEQLLAINEKNKNIIVSAGAGSGKTAVLTERVIKHLENNINVDDLLILTFTNAAAKEMKDRIRKKLQEKNNQEQIDRLEISYITTFDAYAMSLVKKYNNILNISDNITIIDDSILTIKKEEILTNIFEEYYESNNPLFEKLISDFTLKDDKDIFDMIIKFTNQINNLYERDTYLNNYLDNYYSETYLNKLINDYEKLLIEKIDTIKLLLDNIKHYTDNDFYEKLSKSIKPLLESTNYQDIKYNCNNIDIPRLPNNQSEETKSIKEQISDKNKELKKLTIYNDTNELKETYIKTKDYIKIIIEIINKYNKELDKYKRINNTYEFIDIFKLAIDIVKNNKEVKEELKNKYYEIMIDEYQDTNDLQELFISYIANNNVYMVGDIKQSIYRFRNANPNIFKQKYDEYKDNANGLKIDLNQNYRSRKEVLKNINDLFNPLMDIEIGGANFFLEHQMIYGNNSYDNVSKENYNMEVLNYTLDDTNKFSKEEIEIFTIAKDIKNKIDNKYTLMNKDTKEIKEVDYNDFVILLDRSKDFDLYKKIFEYLKIPLTIIKDDTLSDSIDLSILKNIYNLIISINKNNYDELFFYSYISVARSHLFEMKDNDILKIINERSYASTKIYEICYELSKQLDELNNYELINLIIDKFNFYEKIIKIGNINEHIVNIDAILNIAKQMNRLKYTPEYFLKYLEEVKEKELKIPISLNKDNNNSVKIMTIHHSKGLEFPICYYANLSKNFNIKELNDRYNYDLLYGFVLPYKDNDIISNTFVKTLLKRKYMNEEISERIRLLYVALTRAKEKMIFVTNIEEPLIIQKENSIINNETRSSYKNYNNILESLYNILKLYIINIDINELLLTKEYNKTMDTNYHFKLGKPLTINDISYNNSFIKEKKLSKDSNELILSNEYINKGKELHYLFETSNFYNSDNIYIKNFVNTKILDNVLKIYKEYEFIYEHDDIKEHGIIDLLLIYNDHIKIVDYKLKNTKDDAYQKQLNGYKTYIESITNKPVIIYLYSILDNNLEEI